ncbi:MAG: slipin family protein [Gammaproteobacteria bacterium]|nr:slipin family protein [Gammaproteobacteria bacterium]MYD80392.1 slipin family protein [Gammaproteobacteria bacterium]
MIIFFAAIAFLLVIFLISSLRIMREYERAVVLFLGRFQNVKGPGLIIVIPIIQQMIKVDLRTVTMDVPTQDLITRDNVSVQVNAVLYFRVLKPKEAIINVEDYMLATEQLAQTTLRSVLGQHELDQLLAERERLNENIQAILDQQTDQWGIKVANVEIKHVDIDATMVRAIAKQAEAERERRAKIIHADGEFEASTRLVDAAEKLSAQSGSMQLRYLQTLTEIAGEKSSTIVFPLPVNLMESLHRLTQTDPTDQEDEGSTSAA